MRFYPQIMYTVINLQKSSTLSLGTVASLPPASKVWGRYCFHRCVCSQEWVPHLHSKILPLVPCPFPGVPHLHPIILPLPLVPCPFWVRGTAAWGTPWARSGWEYPRKGDCPLARVGYPQARNGVPLARSGQGYPGGGTPSSQ